MKRLRKITTIFILLSWQALWSKTLKFREFIVGEKRQAISKILRAKYKDSCITENNDNFGKKNAINIHDSAECSTTPLVVMFFNDSDQMISMIIQLGHIELQEYSTLLARLVQSYGAATEEGKQEGDLAKMQRWRLQKNRYLIQAWYGEREGACVTMKDRVLDEKYSMQNSKLKGF